MGSCFLIAMLLLLGCVSRIISSNFGMVKFIPVLLLNVCGCDVCGAAARQSTESRVRVSSSCSCSMIGGTFG